MPGYINIRVCVYFIFFNMRSIFEENYLCVLRYTCARLCIFVDT